jgi:hypothetical protein
VLILIAVMGTLEVLILIGLLAFDTPLTPLARIAVEKPSGIAVLVASILLVLCLANAVFWAAFNRFKGTESDGPNASRRRT